jgi:beta-alanine degradation protein BauB
MDEGDSPDWDPGLLVPSRAGRSFTGPMGELPKLSSRLGPRRFVMPHAADVLDVASNAYRLVLENDRVRVLEVVLQPQERAVMHNHPHDHLVYVLNDAKFRLESPDGKTGEFDLKAGQALMIDAGDHETTNIGKTVGRNIVVELKS